MRRRDFGSTLILSLGIALAFGGSRAAAAGSDPAPLVLERTIPLKGVAGRIDHLAIDLKRHRLFVAEFGNGSVDDVDLDRGERVHRITGLKEPQGLVYDRDRDELVVATGGDGKVRFYKGDALTPSGEVSLGDDADNVRLDRRAGRVWVGYGTGALAGIDLATHKVVATLPLPAHPEGIRLDFRNRRAIVNLPNVGETVVGDLTTGKVLATWPAAHGMTFPMAYNSATTAVAVVSRIPARLSVLDSGSGKVRQDLETCGDADDLFFDPKRSRIYVSCGLGAVDVFQKDAFQKDGEQFRRTARVPTPMGARTSLFVPKLDRLFVAVRAGILSPDAAILVYRPQ